MLSVTAHSRHELNDLPMGYVKILANITDHGLDQFFFIKACKW